MPTYNYRCTNQDCQAECERFHGINGHSDLGCPVCGYPMKKLVSSAEFKFKSPRGIFKITNAATPDKDPEVFT